VFSQIVFVERFVGLTPTLRRSRAEIIVNATNRGSPPQSTKACRQQTRGLCLANPDVTFTKARSKFRRIRSVTQRQRQEPEADISDGRPMSVRRFHDSISGSRQSPHGLEGLIPGKDRYGSDGHSTQVEAVAATFMLETRWFMAAEEWTRGTFCMSRTLTCKRWRSRVEVGRTEAPSSRLARGSGRDPVLGLYHRNGIRRHFQIHHGDKPVCNLLLFGLLKLAG
jgi:hypothetical protein